MMKTMVIINPASRTGRDPRLAARLKKRLSSLDPCIMNTRYPGHATLLAAQGIDLGYRRVIAVGGDGTVNEVLNAVVGTRVTLGIIPAGTANDVAAHYGIPCDTEEACDTVLNGDIHQPDVIAVNDWHFLTIGGIGLPCDTLAVAESIKSKDRLGRLLAFSLGSRVYLLALMIALMKKRWGSMNLSLKVDPGRDRTRALSLIVGNQPSLGRHFHVLPDAKNDDGLLDVFVLRNTGRPVSSLITMGRSLSGNHVGRADVRMIRTDRIDIQTRHAVPFFGDGQIGVTGKSFSVRIIPKGVNLVTPQNYEGN